MRHKKSPTTQSTSGEDREPILQFTIRLLGVSPPIWRRILVPGMMTLRELHGAIQIAMGWQGFHLFVFEIRAQRYGSWELSADSPDKRLSEFSFRRGARFTYDYDLNIPWEHELRLEAIDVSEAGLAFPVCLGGKEACPPEDCPGPQWFMENREPELSEEGLDDFEILSGLLSDIQDVGASAASGDEEAAEALEAVVERIRAREEWRGVAFKQARVNERFKKAEHLDLMHQQIF